MEKLIKKTGKESIFISLCLIVLSIVLISTPGEIAKIITYMGAGILFFIGVSRIITSYKVNREFSLKNFDNVSGIVLVLAGLFTLIFSSTIFALIRIILGLWITYNGILRLVTAFRLKQIYASTWIPYLVIAMLLIIGGLYLIFTSNALIRAAGVVLLISSILDLIGGFIFNSHVDELFR
jgi:uncharacterized membrane protein HdeD (DUF308 family)